MKTSKIIYCLIALLSLTEVSQAQGLLDGFTPKKGDLSVTASQTRSNYKKFYAGETKLDAVPAHNKITQDIFSLYAKYGITDRLSAVINAPYIIANGDGVSDPVNGKSEVSGFQDISLALKYNAYKLGVGFGDLNLVTGVGVNIPTGYEPNGILSLGNGAFATDLTAGLHLNTHIGFFGTALATYSFRGDAENNGSVANDFVSGADFNVPDAFLAAGKIGYASSFIYVEGWIDYARSVKGVDIGTPAFKGNFPETKVGYTRLGATVYKNVLPELGVSAGYSKVVSGRNIGIASNYSLGLTYNFSLQISVTF